jgi:hypothetical protein
MSRDGMSRSSSRSRSSSKHTHTTTTQVVVLLEQQPIGGSHWNSRNSDSDNNNNNNTSWVLDEEEMDFRSFADAQQHPNDSNQLNQPNTNTGRSQPESHNILTSWTREYDAEWQVQELERRSRQCQERCLSVLFGLDLFIFGLAWTIYAGLLFWYNTNYFESHDPSVKIFLAVAILLAVLLCCRSICGLCALRLFQQSSFAARPNDFRCCCSGTTTACCCWRGVVVPISVLLTLFYGVATVMLGLVSWMEPHAVEHFISRHVQHDGTSASSSSWLLPKVLARWILQMDQHHAAATQHNLCILGVLLLVVEWMKWQLASYYYYRHCIRVVSSSSPSTSPPPIRSVSYNNNNHTITNASWWSGTMSAIGEEDDYHDSPAVWHEPLLSDGRRHRRRSRPRPQGTSWWHNFFIRRPQREDDNLSVASSSSSSETGLFASVQEEWATRSQESGPLWWASRQEENQHDHHQHYRPAETDPEEQADQPSWVQNTNRDQ